MAIADIPEFITFEPGDPIRSDDWNTIQRRARNAARAHRHTRPASLPPDDSSQDEVAQRGLLPTFLTLLRATVMKVKFTR